MTGATVMKLQKKKNHELIINLEKKNAEKETRKVILLYDWSYCYEITEEEKSELMVNLKKKNAEKETRKGI